MNEELEQIADEQETILIKKDEIAPRIAAKRKKVSSGMFGIAEIIAVSIGLLSLLCAVLFYLLWVSPAQAQLAKHKETRNQLDSELTTANSRYGNITTTKERVDELVNSVDYFERNYLPVAENGRTALYQRLNALIQAYGLVNTSGPEFAPLEIAEIREKGEQGQESGKAKFKSLFPGVYVTATLDGSYQNLRRFMREIESSGQFVIISTVELEASDAKESGGNDPAKGEKAPKTKSASQPYSRGQDDEEDLSLNQPNPLAPGMPGNPAAPKQPAQKPFVKPKGKSHGDTVSLHLEMAAYFRRNIKSEEQALADQKR